MRIFEAESTTLSKAEDSINSSTEGLRKKAGFANQQKAQHNYGAQQKQAMQLTEEVMQISYAFTQINSVIMDKLKWQGKQIEQ